MSRKPQVELLPPEKADALDRLAALVADRLAQRSSTQTSAEKQKPLAELSEEVLLEPWFLPKEIADEILRLLPLPHRQRWARYFEKWGCLMCARKDVIHGSKGFCNRCRVLIQERLKTAIKQAEQERKGENP